jgi:hypothetical protein
MSEPFLERLSRFTPDASRLDRDALLFAAGRSSARPNTGWITLASLLAGTQVLSLVLLWPHRNQNPSAEGLTVAVEPTSPHAATIERRAVEAAASSGVWSARHNLLESEAVDWPVANLALIDSGPPWRASRAIPPPLLN